MRPLSFWFGMEDRNRSIVSAVADLLEPALQGMGYELVEVEYVCERGRWVLRLYIDREEGITLDDCAGVSRELGDVLDSRDLIPHAYVLEVSSPGLNRPLRKEKDFAQRIGRRMKIRMMAPVQGRRNFVGMLTDFRDRTLFLEVDRETFALPWKEVEKAHLVYEFEAP
ncbi:MAG: ribosome maturation factor RimP [Thermodesulfobacteriota bacterium]